MINFTSYVVKDVTGNNGNEVLSLIYLRGEAVAKVTSVKNNLSEWDLTINYCVDLPTGTKLNFFKKSYSANCKPFDYCPLNLQIPTIHRNTVNKVLAALRGK